MANQLSPLTYGPGTHNALQEIINTVLYEGYILHSHRASSPDNHRERFTFGRVYPEIYRQRQDDRELCQIQAEVLMETDNHLPELQITLGFLQPVQTEIGTLPQPLQKLPRNEDLHFGEVPELELNPKLYHTWMEAVERQVTVPLKTLHGSVEALFNFEAECQLDPIFDEHGLIVATSRRRQSPISGKVIVKSKVLKNGLSKISVTVVNQSSVEEPGLEIPEKILRSTFTSAHVILRAKHGRFVSLWEAPDELKYFAVQCQNTGVWPVLVGDKSQDDRSTMLASPILLYDHPQIPPKNEDELTDARKTETQLDDFSRRLPKESYAFNDEAFSRRRGEKCEINFSNEEFFNPARPVKTVLVNGVELGAGDKVFIRPASRADAIDAILAGKSAVIETLEQDAKGQIHLALVLEDETKDELGLARQSGHHFFYGADEVEPFKLELTL